MQKTKENITHFLETRLLPIGFLLVFSLYLFANDKNEMQTSFYLLILLPGLILLAKHFHSIFKNIYFAPVLLFLIYSAASIFWRTRYDLADVSSIVKTIIYIIIFSMVIGIISKQKNFLQIYNILCIVATASALYSLYRFYFIYNIEFGTRLRSWGNLSNPLRAATVYGHFALLVLLGILNRQYKSKLATGFYLLILATLCFSLFHTLSRGPIGAFFITSSAAIFVSMGKYRKKILLILFLGAALIILMFPDIISHLLQRGTSGRHEIWSQALTGIKEAPFFGHGINAEPKIYFQNILFESAHNRLLSTMYYTGAIGGLLLITILALAFWPVKYKQSMASQYAKYMLLYACLCSLTEGKYLISRPDMVWLIFWLPLSVLLMEKYYQHQTKQNSTAK